MENNTAKAPSPICDDCELRHVGWIKKRADGSKVWRRKCEVCRGNAPKQQADRWNLIAHHGLYCDRCGFQARDFRQLRHKGPGHGVLCLNCAAVPE